MRKHVLTVAAILSSYGNLANTNEIGNDVLGLIDLKKVADQIKNFKPKDEFDVTPIVSSLTGRKFSVTVKPAQRGPSNSICDGFPSWGYFAQQGILEISFNNGSILTNGLSNDPFTAAFPKNESMNGSFLRFASFTCDKKKQGEYSAMNGFGATVSVSKETDVVIAFSEQDSASLIPADAVSSWSHAVSGDIARSLTKSLAIRITGVVGIWANGNNVICGINRNVPKFDFPYDHTLNACIFKATSLKFEVLNEKNGEVLYSVYSTNGRAD